MLDAKKASLSSSPPPLQTLPFRYYYILKRTRLSIVLYVIDSPRVACFLRLLLSAGAMRRTRVVPMDDDDEKFFSTGKGYDAYIFGYHSLTHLSDSLRLQLPCDTKTPKTQKYKNKKHHKKSSIPPREFLKKT